ncbi:MAG: hypothetical protein GX638_02665 [Crenarchaeota archaeon]|nr:hypothetical protein [Thermoproteota archaeon]
MVVKKKKRAIIIILSIILVISILMIILLLFKGPTLIINNCNENLISSSKVCHNGNDYYYVDNKGRIHHLNGDSEEIFNDDFDFEYISCNSKCIYAATENELIQFNYNGEVINKLDDSCDYLYNTFSGLYSDDNCLFCCLGGSYVLLDPDTLNSTNISKMMGKRKVIKLKDIEMCLSDDNAIILVNNYADLIMSSFSGGISDEEKIINLTFIGNEGIIATSDNRCFKYYSNNGLNSDM